MSKTSPWAAVALLLALAGCASGSAERAAVCDGRHRRPANPHGSVLTQAPQPARAASTPVTGLAAFADAAAGQPGRAAHPPAPRAKPATRARSHRAAGCAGAR